MTTITEQIRQSPGFYLAGSLVMAIAALVFAYAVLLSLVSGGAW